MLEIEGGTGGENPSPTTDLVPYPRFCPSFVGLRPYHSRCTALAPEMPRARTAGQVRVFERLLRKFVDEDGLEPMIKVL